MFLANMRDASWFWFVLLLLVLVTRSTYGADSKLSDTLKNMTQARNNNTNGNQSGEENLLKAEIKQFLRECGASLPEDEGSNQRFSNNRSSNNYDYKSRRFSNNYEGGSNGGGYSSNYENRKNSGNQNNNNNRGGYSNYNNNNNDNNDENCDNENCGNNNKNNNNNRDPPNAFANYGQSGYNMGSSSYGNGYSSPNDYRYGNCNYGSNGYSYGSDRQGGYGYNRENGYSSNNNGNKGTYDLSYGNRNSGNEQGYGNSNYGSNFMDRGQGNNWNNRNDGSSVYYRGKRSEGSVQCISQCVFGYLEVLDDNRVPSETLLIKWLQDHLTNDIKRIRALREARRCFARLATTDTEDGCEFSKSLSSCLDLDIE